MTLPSWLGHSARIIMRRSIILSLTVLLVSTALAGGQSREQKVLADRKKFEADAAWHYNDLRSGFAEAKKTGKPLLVVLRCIPCEECVKLDDEVVNENERVRPLLEQFIRVRIVGTNGLDLSLFQFDYDQSFAVFLLNADGAIYGRFGTWSHRTSWAGDVSVEGLARALEGALDLHRQYPKNAAALAGKKGPAPDMPTPEQYPLLKDKYGPKLNYAEKVVQSCIHCHQIGDAQRDQSRSLNEPMPDRLLFPYPHPKSLGLILDPKEKATVLEVEKGTPAEQADFRKGDAILSLEGQPLLSIADVQWVLHRANGNGASLMAEVRRNGRNEQLTFELPRGWRQRDDISWRASSWGLRRMALGGMLLGNLTAEERTKAGLPEGSMALRVKHVGQYGPHAAAHQAGVRKDDMVLSFDGKSDFARETDVLAYALTQHKAGDRVKVTLLREWKKIDVTIPMQP
jgi:hypothetical protein